MSSVGQRLPKSMPFRIVASSIVVSRDANNCRYLGGRTEEEKAIATRMGRLLVLVG